MNQLNFGQALDAIKAGKRMLVGTAPTALTRWGSAAALLAFGRRLRRWGS